MGITIYEAKIKSIEDQLKGYSKGNQFNETQLYVASCNLTKKKFFDPVILELICYRARANRLINESNTTGGVRKIWTGSGILFLIWHVSSALLFMYQVCVRCAINFE